MTTPDVNKFCLFEMLQHLVEHTKTIQLEIGKSISLGDFSLKNNNFSISSYKNLDNLLKNLIQSFHQMTRIIDFMSSYMQYLSPNDVAIMASNKRPYIKIYDDLRQIIETLQSEKIYTKNNLNVNINVTSPKHIDVLRTLFSPKLTPKVQTSFEKKPGMGGGRKHSKKSSKKMPKKSSKKMPKKSSKRTSKKKSAKKH